MVGLAVVIGGILLLDSTRVTDTEVAKVDENAPRVLCTEGTTVIKRSEERITLQKTFGSEIKSGDQIKTLPKSSATIFWSDGTFTRLSERATVSVNELASNPENDELNVEFAMEQGKSWTRVYKYLGEGSSVRATFDGGTKIAAVRGTAFEIDADSKMLRTESHAVDVSDLSGTRLKTVAEGKAVAFGDLHDVVGAKLDAAWRQSNLAEDARYSMEYANRVRDRIAKRYSETAALAKRVRNLHSPDGSPLLAVSFSGNALSVNVSTGAIGSPEERAAVLAELRKIYAESAALGNDVAAIASRESLRDTILTVAPENAKKRLVTDFARHQTYESWSDALSGDDESVLRIRKKIREYVRQGADEAELNRIESALPTERIDRFNAVMERLKARGFEELSKDDFFFKMIEGVGTPDAFGDRIRNAVQDQLSDTLIR